jgi:hypothetical protein
MIGKTPSSPRLCLACTHFGLQPAFPAVDPSGASEDEANDLCVRHRAFLTEGFCVLCGRREAWLVIHDQSDIGACRPCYAARFGEEAAQAVETTWEALDQAANL